MTRTLIDLSIALDNDAVADPPGAGPKIAYFAHAETRPAARVRVRGHVLPVKIRAASAGWSHVVAVLP